MVSPSARSHWGGAANAEMKRLMLRQAFTDVQEVLFTVAERNVRSRRAVEKLGAELAEAEEGRRHYRYATLFKHGWIDVLTKKKSQCHYCRSELFALVYRQHHPLHPARAPPIGSSGLFD
jgi:RimJ/RimL family protein N-acetyltransferase